MLTVSKEDYLKAIAEAEAEGQPVIGARLAHWLSVTPPAVTFAVKRLTKDGLVTRGKIEARNYDGTLSLLVDKHPVHLGGVVAEKIWLAKSEPKQKHSR